MHASIVVFGDKQFSRKLHAVGRRAQRARPMYDALGHKVLMLQKQQFSSQGASGSGGWEPLAESTIEAKGHDIIFFETGELMESWKYGDPLNIFEATDDYLLVGSASEHGRWHQPDPQGRRVFELTNAQRADLVRDMQHWVIYGSVRV